MKVSTVFTIISSVLLLAPYSDGYRILGVFPTGAPSHYFVASSLMKGLAAKGHNVTIIAPLKQKSPVPNLREIQTPSVIAIMKAHTANLLNMSQQKSIYSKMFDIHNMGLDLTNAVLSEPSVRELLNNTNETFDVVISEVFVSEALLGFGQHFKAPVIALSTFGTSMWTNDLVGTPSPPSYVPHPFLSFTDHMTFLERLENFALTAYERLLFLSYLPKQAALYAKHFAEPKPDFYDVRKNVSLVLLNTHVALGTPRPYAPNMIEVGGMNINRSPKSLPADMQAFLDSAVDGAIYFSMGSNLKSKDLPKPKLEALLSTFKSLKQKVLWKWEESNLPGKSDNIFISKWFPQDDILAHPNVKLFITHGGLLSTTESIYHGVPVIGIPMYGDQFLNMARAERGGYGRVVNFAELNENKLKAAINEIINNRGYAEKAKAMSERYRDQPMTPLETAIYWVEFVVRQKGAPHLHSGAQDLNFVQYHNLDVIAVFVAAATLIVYLILKTIIAILRVVLPTRNKSTRKVKRN